MSLQTITCYQPHCDAEGCDYIVETDVQVHYESLEAAAEDWACYEGWTDGTTWLCEEHKYAPHAYIDDGDICARCQVSPDEHESEATT